MQEITLDTRDSTANPEKRTQTRVQVDFPISIVAVPEETSISARNRDISWGGAGFVLRSPALQVGDQFRVQFPWTNGESISAYAEVLRTQSIDDGRILVASRFASLSPRSELRLERLLGMLMARQSGADTGDTRCAERLEIVFGDTADMQETLSEIRKGELWVTSFSSYAEDQSIQLALGGTADLPSLTLRARVFHRESVREDKAVWANLHLVGLRFEHSSRQLQVLIDHVLGRLGNPRRENPTGARLDLALAR